MRTEVAGSRRGRPSLCRTARLRELNSSQLPRHANCKDRRWFFNIRSTFFSTLDWETANNNAFKFAKMQILNLNCGSTNSRNLTDFCIQSSVKFRYFVGPPPLFFDQNKAPRTGKRFFGDRPLPPYLRVWLTGPPTYLKVWVWIGH